VPQGSVLGPFLFNIFINDLCNSIQHCNFLIFADDLKIFREISSLRDCHLLQSDINSVCDWCAANSMRLNSNKTRLMSYSRKTNILSFAYRLCHSVIARTTSIKDLGVFFDSKLYFHDHVDFMFSACMKILGLIRSITFRFSSLDCLFLLYCALVRPRLEYASVVWNSITTTDSKKLERIQQKFASDCYYRFFPNLPYSYESASYKLNLPSLSTRRHHLDALFFHTGLSWPEILLFPLRCC
jgi:hypothetical protein